MNVMKYCTNQMLSTLRKVGDGNPIPKSHVDYWPLKARGWINKDGGVTVKGLEYIRARAV